MSPDELFMHSTTVPSSRNDCTPAKVRSTAPVPDAGAAAGDDGDEEASGDGGSCVAASELALEEQADAAATSPSAQRVSRPCARRLRRPMRLIETSSSVVNGATFDHGPAARRR
jgi:hypothetical protein